VATSPPNESRVLQDVGGGEKGGECSLYVYPFALVLLGVHGLGAEDLARRDVVNHGRHVDVAHGSPVVVAVQVAFKSSLSSSLSSCTLTSLSSGKSCI
jgi:hypothetical protein